jgi:adenylosuccinate synthase
VGNGPFPTELTGEIGEKLREAGQEFGATTGRPRRCGWIDLVALKYAVDINGMDELALSKIDILNDFEQVKLCTDYRIDGKTTQTFPLDIGRLERVEPVYKTMEGWEKDISSFKKIDDMPTEVQNFMGYIEDYLDVEIKILSIGPGRSETIER